MCSLSAANARFCLDFFKELNKRKRNENIFFSPLSLSAAFGMVVLGARGSTLEQIEKVGLCSEKGTVARYGPRGWLCHLTQFLTIHRPRAQQALLKIPYVSNTKLLQTKHCYWINCSLNISLLKKVFFRYPCTLKAKKSSLPLMWFFAFSGHPKSPFSYRKISCTHYLLKLLVHLQGFYGKEQRGLSAGTVSDCFGIGLQECFSFEVPSLSCIHPTFTLQVFHFREVLSSTRQENRYPSEEVRHNCTSELKQEEPVCQPFSLKAIT